MCKLAGFVLQCILWLAWILSCCPPSWMIVLDFHVVSVQYSTPWTAYTPCTRVIGPVTLLQATWLQLQYLNLTRSLMVLFLWEEVFDILLTQFFWGQCLWKGQLFLSMKELSLYSRECSPYCRKNKGQGSRLRLLLER